MRILFQNLSRDLQQDDSQPLDGDFLKMKSASAHLIKVTMDRMQSQPGIKIEVTNNLLNKIYKQYPVQIPSTVQGEPPQTVLTGPSGFSLFGYIATLCQFGKLVLKHVILMELPKIAQILNQRMFTYQSNKLQLDAVQASMGLLLRASQELMVYLRDNEPSNEAELKKVQEIAFQVFGAKLDPLMAAPVAPSGGGGAARIGTPQQNIGGGNEGGANNNPL